MTKYLVVSYRTIRGYKPVDDFINQQDKATRSKVSRFRSLLKTHGPDLGMPYARYLKNGLYELRIHGGNEVRIFYVILVTGNTVMLLHAFKKRTQKLPKKELEMARRRQKELTGL